MNNTILTNIGRQKFLTATPENQIEIKKIILGDGGGEPVAVDPDMKWVVNEVESINASLPIRYDDIPDTLVFEGVSPVSKGGYTIREIGLVDADGDLVAIGSTPTIVKPAPENGGIEVLFRPYLKLDNASDVDLIVYEGNPKDHSKLINRNAPDSHPASAISYENGNVAGKLDELSDDMNRVGSLIRDGVDTHNHDPNAHPELSEFISLEADRAEAAKDAAYVNADVYPSVAEGLSETEQGQQFQVATENYIIRYKNNGSVASEVSRMPTLSTISIEAASKSNCYYFAPLPTRFTVDSQNSTIEITGGRFIQGTKTVLARKGVVSFDRPGTNAMYYLVANMETGDVSIHSGEELASLRHPHSPFGQIRLSTNKPSHGLVTGLPSGYARDGVLYRPYSTDDGGDTPVEVDKPTAIAYAEPKNVNISLADEAISFRQIRIYAGRTTYLVSSQDVSFSTYPNGIYYIVFDISNNKILLADAGGVDQSDHLVIARFNKSQEPAIWGLPGGYSLDGAVFTTTAARTNITQALVADAEDIDFLFTLNTLRVSKNITVPYQQWRLLVPPQDVSLSEAGTGWGTLLVNPSTLKIEVKRTPALHNSGYPIIGFFRKSGERVVGFDRYSVNGKPNTSVVQPPNVITMQQPSMAWSLDGILDAPDMPGYTTNDPLPLNSIKTSDIYGWYDSLMAAAPTGYITKTELKKDREGQSIFCYTFRPPTPSEGPNPLVRVMAQSGIHGEPMSYVYLYHLMESIVNSWETSEILEAFRWGCEFSIIPALSPYVVDNRSRVNSAGVNLNRNYPVGWTAIPEGINYSGPEPLSEPETQASYEKMVEFKPHVFLDCHSYNSNGSGRVLWFPSRDDIAIESANALILRLSAVWRKENPWLATPDILGHSNKGATGTAGQTAHSIGARAMTSEVSQMLDGVPEGEAFGNPLLVKLGVGAVGSLVASLIKRSDKIDGN